MSAKTTPETSAGVFEPSRRLPVRGAYDVVVAGGGFAGVAAALSAARAGAKTALLEREYALGGLGTLGLVVMYLPICDGRGRLVSRGLAEELLHLSISDGASGIPAPWRDPEAGREARAAERFKALYNPAGCLLALERRVLDEGVDLLYGAHVAAARCADGAITHLIVESKSGREAIACGAAVDATGDADLCRAAGEPTVSVAHNSPAGWYYAHNGGEPKLYMLSLPYDPLGRGVPPETGRGYAGDDAAEATAHVVASRALLRRHAETAGRPVMTPVIPCLRMTRRLAGAAVVSGEDRRDYPDGVGLFPDWTKAGPVYSAPLAALRGVVNRNIYAAGRCMSAEGSGWNAARAIPACAVTGEAAGLAAALGAGAAPSAVRAILRRRGVKLDMADLEGA